MQRPYFRVVFQCNIHCLEQKLPHFSIRRLRSAVQKTACFFFCWGHLGFLQVASLLTRGDFLCSQFDLFALKQKDVWGETQRVQDALAHQQAVSLCPMAANAAYCSQMVTFFHLELFCRLWWMVMSHRKDGFCLNVKERIITPTCFHGA